ncbi:hypothetical protein [Enterobacterales bacterium endosymbiont of Anomoneura mori]|uniref:hypothetical protein n=1 Tax=Enterobacterales bacterium endosymbiont of Anomoneura mori TaxID=3132096 RepID=UPI00399C9329
MWTKKENGEFIKLYYDKNIYDEALYILRNILKLLKKGYKYSDCAILYKNNFQLYIQKKFYLIII